MSQQDNSELVRNLKPYLVSMGTPELASSAAFSIYSHLLGLRGFWPMSGGVGGGANDFSGNGLTLTNNNTATFVYRAGSVACPAIRLNGSTQYLSHADHGYLDITGSESYIFSTQRGLTVGAWVSFDNTASGIEQIVGKRLATTEYSYMLRRLGTGTASFGISSSGTNTFGATTTGVADDSGFFFFCGRFRPSTDVKVWLNTETDTNTTSIPASIYSGSAGFGIGATTVPSQHLDGDIALVFLCAAALQDQVIEHLYESTRGLFVPTTPA